MTIPHRATPEQWAFVADDAIGDCDLHSLCLLELRDRLAAAEQRISDLEGNHLRPAPEMVTAATANAGPGVTPQVRSAHAPAQPPGV